MIKCSSNSRCFCTRWNYFSLLLAVIAAIFLWGCSLYSAGTRDNTIGDSVDVNYTFRGSEYMLDNQDDILSTYENIPGPVLRKLAVDVAKSGKESNSDGSSLPGEFEPSKVPSNELKVSLFTNNVNGNDDISFKSNLDTTGPPERENVDLPYLPDEYQTNNEIGRQPIDIASSDEFSSKCQYLFANYCKRFVTDTNWQLQFSLLVLSYINWPTYTRKSKWHPTLIGEFVKLIMQQLNQVDTLKPNNPRTATVFGKMKKCQFVPILSRLIPNMLVRFGSYEDFNAALKKRIGEDAHLNEMLQLIPATKWALDERYLAIGYVIYQVADLQFLYTYSNSFSTKDLHHLFRRKNLNSMRHFATGMMLMGFSTEKVDESSMSAVFVLKLTTQVDQGLHTAMRTFREDHPTLERMIKAFEKRLKNGVQHSVARVLMKMSMLHDLNWLNDKEKGSLLFPEIIITSYYATGGSESEYVVERGAFGEGLSTKTVDEMKQNLKDNEIYVQLSLTDPSPEEAKVNESRAMNADLAARLFAEGIREDPTLPGVGLVSVAHYSFIDMNSVEENGSSSLKEFDGNLHIMVYMPPDKYRGSDNFRSQVLAAASIHPVGEIFARHVDPERIRVQGYASGRSGSRALKMGRFGAGLTYQELAQVDNLLKTYHFLVHVFIRGLHDNILSKQTQATAQDILRRFTGRFRGIYKKLHQISNCHRQSGYPGWVLGVALGSVLVFFFSLLGFLLLRKVVDLPWWLNCFCSPFAPFERQLTPEEPMNYGDSQMRSKNQNLTPKESFEVQTNSAANAILESKGNLSLYPREAGRKQGSVRIGRRSVSNMFANVGTSTAPIINSSEFTSQTQSNRLSSFEDAPVEDNRTGGNKDPGHGYSLHDFPTLKAAKAQRLQTLRRSSQS